MNYTAHNHTTSNRIRSYRTANPPKNGGRKGAVAVEFAVCVPLLFALLFGCYELARANLIQHATESAAYEAARVGIIPGATEAEIKDATTFVFRSVGVRNFEVSVSPSVITQDTEKVTVDISVPYRANTNITTYFFDDATFRGSCTLNRETL